MLLNQLFGAIFNSRLDRFAIKSIWIIIYKTATYCVENFVLEFVNGLENNCHCTLVFK